MNHVYISHTLLWKISNSANSVQKIRSQEGHLPKTQTQNSPDLYIPHWGFDPPIKADVQSRFECISPQIKEIFCLNKKPKWALHSTAYFETRLSVKNSIKDIQYKYSHHLALDLIIWRWKFHTLQCPQQKGLRNTC